MNNDFGFIDPFSSMSASETDDPLGEVFRLLVEQGRALRLAGEATKVTNRLPTSITNQISLQLLNQTGKGVEKCGDE